jgi:hypothetical protein
MKNQELDTNLRKEERNKTNQAEKQNKLGKKET